MDVVIVFLKSLISAWPSILMGCLIPVATLCVLFFVTDRKAVAFKAVLYGFATFFASLAVVAVLLLAMAQLFMPTITTSQASDANKYIYAAGSLILLLFYVVSEALKQFSFRSVIKSEKSKFAGFTFGSGFILAQNLLIVGLIYGGGIDMKQLLGFGLLMILCGVIYLLNSELSFLLTREGSWLTGSATTGSYYLILAVMLIFANVYVSYVAIACVLAFNVVIGYRMLAKKGEAKDV